MLAFMQSRREDDARAREVDEASFSYLILVRPIVHQSKPSIPDDDSVKSHSPLSPEDLRRLDAYWRAANYLAVGQIYLLDNPLLAEPLRPEH